MGWMQKCCETYENNLHLAGMPVEGDADLCPLFYMSNKAQIEITVTGDGSFYEAKPVPKDDAATLIPVTESSASRSGTAIYPHPFSDQLNYIALGSDKYPDSEEFRKKYESYISGIKSWAESEFSNIKIRAVYKYCLEGSVVTNLQKAGVISCDGNGRLTSGKIEGTPYEKCLVRWRVLTNDGGDSATWRDAELFESYRAYHISVQDGAKKGLCYVSGEEKVLAANHPKGILRFAYGAKLLSSNDASGFTYRGRFIDSGEALSVGEDVTQKAHSALRWIAANQGVPYGGRTFVCWNPKGKKVPQPDALSSLGAIDDEPERTAHTMPEYREKLQKAFSGYTRELDGADDIEIIALDAATTGRLSITYYNELLASDFLDRLHSWGETCCWYFTAFTQDKKPHFPVRTPSPYHIVTCAFGAQQGERLEIDGKVLKEHAQRILHCMIDRQPVPADIVRALTVKASAPQSYNRSNYETVLSVSCAVVRKYHNQRNEREDWKMELDAENSNRSYLFGRLLAVAEKVETRTYTKEEGNREPNAARLRSAFVAHPLRTWALLEKSLVPYYAKLSPDPRQFYRGLTAEIVSGFETDDSSKLNKPLEDVYLMGYYLERKKLNEYKQEDDKNGDTSKQN